MSINQYQADQVRHFMERGCTLEEALARLATPVDDHDDGNARDHFNSMKRKELLDAAVELDAENSKQESVYHCFVSEAQDAILEELRSRIANVAGVTLTGNRLTVRWNEGDKLVHVHCVVLEAG